jgi:hypothetical protein
MTQAYRCDETEEENQNDSKFLLAERCDEFFSIALFSARLVRAIAQINRFDDHDIERRRKPRGDRLQRSHDSQLSRYELIVSAKDSVRSGPISTCALSA